ncbi:URC4/urg3 family protein [Peredibacter sp. HCB2-198]|uniref:URC4/urg3 family protein n=1 Tax=Peredibacter sp. HCB2-198 TaxID=3383025 RepID=UPI0038B42453
MSDLDYILSPVCVRDGAKKIFDETLKGNTHFHYHEEKMGPTVDFVMQTIRENYPDMNIPFHSRWGHFRPGNVDRSLWLKAKIKDLDPMEQARIKWDLVIPSVLLDAGAGPTWKYHEKETSRDYARSEGLGVASYHLFMSGAFSSDGKSLRSDATGLSKVTPKLIEEYFQVTPNNPLVGVEGRTNLLKNLGRALENKTLFKDGRPGNLIDYLVAKHGKTIPALALLRGVLDGLGPIWPGRETLNGVNLGDAWKHTKFGLVAFHKLSQWMTYSLVEPLLEAGITVTGIEGLTGLPEYRNGGLLLDTGVLTFKNSKDGEATWGPESDLIIEWRALTVFLLDKIGAEVQNRLGKTPADFPLAKVLEGGTWWAGRKIAAQNRAGGTPPLNIKSDGTVF